MHKLMHKWEIKKFLCCIDYIVLDYSTNRNKNENRFFLRFHTRLLFTDEQYVYRNSMKHLLDMSMNSNKETAQNHKNLVVEFS